MRVDLRTCILLFSGSTTSVFYYSYHHYRYCRRWLCCWGPHYWFRLIVVAGPRSCFLRAFLNCFPRHFCLRILGLFWPFFPNFIGAAKSKLSSSVSIDVLGVLGSCSSVSSISSGSSSPLSSLIGGEVCSANFSSCHLLFSPVGIEDSEKNFVTGY